MSELDHIVLAAPDLDEAKRSFNDQTGVMPMDGGPHENLGTRNALVSFGDGVYLEIIAPDPEQPPYGQYFEPNSKSPVARFLFDCELEISIC